MKIQIMIKIKIIMKQFNRKNKIKILYSKKNYKIMMMMMKQIITQNLIMKKIKSNNYIMCLYLILI